MSIADFFALLGGVGLFLLGMTLMSSGLQSAAGDKVRTILEHATSNKIRGILLGMGVTVLIQSSSATDMMVIGFVNSGLMNLKEAIAVIMGANIGTTITAQITAFDLTAFAPLLLFIGCVMYLFMSRKKVKSVGMIILGFGMLFVGVGLIKDAIKPLSQSAQFEHFLAGLSNPALAVLFGIAFTALLQSSSSSTVIFQTFAVQGILNYQTTVYLLIGAAIGSVTPNLLAGLTTNRNGKRSAVLNLVFNLLRAALLLTIISIFPQVLDLICRLSPNNIGRQIANTHTIFAIFSVLVLAPFSGLIVRLSEMMIPRLPEETRMLEGKKLLYLNSAKSTLPSVQIRQAVLECKRMGEMTLDNLKLSLQCFFEGGNTQKLMNQVEDTESIIDYLCQAISDRLMETRSLDLTDADAFRASKLMVIAMNFERIGDQAENIIEFRQKLDEQNDKLSAAGKSDLQKLSEKVVRSVELCIDIFSEEDFSKLPEASENEDQVDRLHDQITNNHVQRLMSGNCNPMAGIVFTDMTTDLERCADNAFNISTALFKKTS